MTLFITGVLTLITLSALSSVFIMAEYSLVASRRTRLTEMAAMGRPGARTVLLVMTDLERFLAGAQTGITVISIAVGILAEPPISGGIEHGLALTIELSQRNLTEDAQTLVGVRTVMLAFIGAIGAVRVWLHRHHP